MDRSTGLETDRNVLSLLEKMEKQVQELKSRYKKIHNADDSEEASQGSYALSNALESVGNSDSGINGIGGGQDADLVDAYLQLNKEVQELIAFKRASSGRHSFRIV